MYFFKMLFLGAVFKWSIMCFQSSALGWCLSADMVDMHLLQAICIAFSFIAFTAYCFGFVFCPQKLLPRLGWSCWLGKSPPGLMWTTRRLSGTQLNILAITTLRKVRSPSCEFSSGSNVCSYIQKAKERKVMVTLFSIGENYSKSWSLIITLFIKRLVPSLWLNATDIMDVGWKILELFKKKKLLSAIVGLQILFAHSDKFSWRKICPNTTIFWRITSWNILLRLILGDL